MPVVYALQAGEAGPVKIGCTGSGIYNRIRQLQAASPYELKWIGAWVGATPDEQDAHAQLAPYRLRGEWYHPVAPVLDLVEQRSGGDFSPERFIEDFCRKPELLRIRKALKAAKWHWGTLEQAAGVRCLTTTGWNLYLSPPPDDIVQKLLNALPPPPAPSTEEGRAQT